MYFTQERFAVRCEWGLQGIHHLVDQSDVIVVVDVLSFCTAVDIATKNGAMVYPYASNDEDAQTYATSRNAILAQLGRTHGKGFSLSPSSMTSIPAGTRLVLPSPNGSRLSLATSDTVTLAGCLRNAETVAQAAEHLGQRISIIPAGERWRHDGTIRFALEDWVGAGAIIHFLHGTKSPEALAAENAFLSVKYKLYDGLIHSGSGRELIERGFEGDVALAFDLGVSHNAPRLRDGAYVASSVG